MSIEVTLDRIAVALEQIAKAVQTGAQAPVPAVVKESKKKAVETAVAAPVEVEQDPFAQETAPVPAAVTFDALTELLKEHAKKLGTKVTVALIIKHGADRATPKMNTIPEANFQKCFEEATADLKKVEGKK